MTELIRAGHVLTTAELISSGVTCVNDQFGHMNLGTQTSLLSGDRPGTVVVHDAYAQLVFGAGPADVSDVWVAGQRLLEDGRHTTLDLAEVTNAARDAAQQLEAAGGIPLATQIRRQ